MKSRSTANKEYKKHMNLLRNLGLKESQQIFSHVCNTPTSSVANAIELFQAIKRYQSYFSPNTEEYFIKLLKGRWAEDNITSVLNNPEYKNERKAIFILWFEKAKAIGAFNYWEDDENIRYVAQLESGLAETLILQDLAQQSERDRKIVKENREKFIEAWGRGYTMDYLRACQL